MLEAIKKFFSKIYYYPYLSEEVAEANQAFIRRTEWKSIRGHIVPGSTFLDVGCGTGFNMMLAAREMACNVWGIDPEPGHYGVGRFSGTPVSDRIIQAYSEDIPFPDQKFDIVFSSHTLEHVSDTNKSLEEIRRVMKDDGILIIGMPTAAMAFVLLISELMFVLPARIVNYIAPKFTGSPKTGFRDLLPPSHSHAGKTVFFDLKYYRVKNWQKILSQYFQVHDKELPLMCPYPELRQIFKPFTSKYISSSVFFICTKPGQPLKM